MTALERLKDMWQKATAMLRSEKQDNVAPGFELDYKALTVSPVDAQLIDMMKLNRSMIAGFSTCRHTRDQRPRKSHLLQYFRTGVPVCSLHNIAVGDELGAGGQRVVAPRRNRRPGNALRFNTAGLLWYCKRAREVLSSLSPCGWMTQRSARVWGYESKDGLDEMLGRRHRPAKSTTRRTLKMSEAKSLLQRREGARRNARQRAETDHQVWFGL